jgi:hypothetical protein
MRGFSVASVVLSYFLVAGGLFAGTLLMVVLKTDREIPRYALLAAGACFGGFVAARASRGSTVLEPAIGAIAVVATIVALAASTDIGRLIWLVAKDATMRFVATVGVTCAGGAIVGAFVSEKLLGEATESSAPWIIYSAMSAFGACLLATLFASFLFLTDGQDPGVASLAKTMMIGMVAGCVIAGIAIGASARSRPIGAAFVGGGLGVAGFFYMIHRLSPGDSKDAALGIAVLAAGGAIVSFIGAVVGWAAVGRRQAG